MLDELQAAREVKVQMDDAIELLGRERLFVLLLN